MSIITSLLRLNKLVQRRKDVEFSIPIKVQMDYLWSFSEPKDDIERSFFQYKCQCFLRGKLISSIINLFCLPPYFYLRKKFKKGVSNKHPESYVDAVFLSDGKDKSIIPNTLLEKYPIMVEEETVGYELELRDLEYIDNIKRIYPFSFEFILKSLIKIARYRYIINRKSPKALIVCDEYSFTSSLLRSYCNANFVSLINVMHGEKLLCIHDAFFHYDSCYVWDSHYSNIFIKLRAYTKQFIIELPPMLIYQDCNVVPRAMRTDYTYYLGMENKKELVEIINLLSLLAKKGLIIAIRPHPRYSNIALLRNMIKGKVNLTIEDGSVVSIEESIGRTRAIISRLSTVLLQSYFMGKELVVDDLSAPKKYTVLNDMDYIILKVKHRLLSEILGDSDAFVNKKD